jgi:hypothetical protein
MAAVLCWFGCALGLLSGNLTGLLIAAVYGAAAIGLHKRRAWARTTAIIISGALGLLELVLTFFSALAPSQIDERSAIPVTLLGHLGRMLLHAGIFFSSLMITAKDRGSSSTIEEHRGTV